MTTIPPTQDESANSASPSRPHRSYSQLALYERCPYSYLLLREEQVWDRPDAWRPHGTALHSAIEFYERSDRKATRSAVGEVFLDTYWAEIRKMKERTPRISGSNKPDFSWWSDSGPYKAEDDVKRRKALGLSQAVAYIEFCEANPDQVPWVDPTGEKAIELTLEIELGGVPVVARIDQVLKHPKHDLIIRDFKIKRPKKGTHQLCVYAIAVNLSYGTDIDQGDYWTGESGKPTRIKALAGRGGEECTVDHLTGRFVQLDDDVRAGNFPPRPDPGVCGSCSVNHACRFRAI